MIKVIRKKQFVETHRHPKAYARVADVVDYTLLFSLAACFIGSTIYICKSLTDSTFTTLARLVVFFLMLFRTYLCRRAHAPGLAILGWRVFDSQGEPFSISKTLIGNFPLAFLTTNPPYFGIATTVELMLTLVGVTSTFAFLLILLKARDKTKYNSGTDVLPVVQDEVPAKPAKVQPIVRGSCVKVEPHCEICGTALAGMEIVSCASCGTPHHKDCWNFNRKCSTYGCRCRKTVKK